MMLFHWFLKVLLKFLSKVLSLCLHIYIYIYTRLLFVLKMLDFEHVGLVGKKHMLPFFEYSDFSENHFHVFRGVSKIRPWNLCPSCFFGCPHPSIS